MNVFLVEVKNQPGEMARATERLAGKGINVLPCCLGVADQFALALVTNDDEASRSALTEGGESFREIPVVTVGLEDKPGTAATLCRQIADADINIELFVPIAKTNGSYTFAIGTNDIDATKKLLEGQLTDFTYS